MLLSEIPIIAYHKISPKKEFGITTISPEIFEEHLSSIHEAGYETLTFIDYYKLDKKQLPEKPLIISFDDTYQSIFDYAFPIMRKFNYSGVLFVISDYIGKINSWEAYKIQRNFQHADLGMIKAMLDYGFEIASHGKTHEYLPFLSTEKTKNELNESKSFLEKTFNTEIISFCYPYGRYSNKVIEQVTDAGYKCASGNLYFNHYNCNNNYCLQRRSIYSIDNTSTILDKIEFPAKQSLNFFLELLIQKCAYAGILKKQLYNFF